METESKKNKENGLTSFMPNEDVELIKAYHPFFKKTIEDNTIQNVGVTGPYGAGKSTAIMIGMKDVKDKTVFISLAAFGLSDNDEFLFLQNNSISDSIKIRTSTSTNEEEHIPNQKIKPNRITQRIESIEKSILQQLIFREKPNKFPASGLVRLGDWSFFKTIVITTFILSLVFLFNNETIIDSLTTYFDNFIYDFRYLSILLIAVLSFVFGIMIMHSILSLLSRNLSKLSLKTKYGDLSIGDSKDSIFNKYLQEILYFFSKTKIKYVVFEDLDRFDSVNIFSKLREMNKIINDCETTHTCIKFIYAVKEELFESATDKTKFFDFVIPIIPVVTSHNSHELMFEQINNLGLEKTPDKMMINDTSQYLVDFRVIKSIANEYLLYSHVIGEKNLNANELYCIILFKHLFPKEYSRLITNEDKIGNIFRKLNEYTNDRIKKIENEIGLKNKMLREISQENLESIQELNYAVMLKFVNSYPSLQNLSKVNELIKHSKTSGFDRLLNQNIRFLNVAANNYVTLNDFLSSINFDYNKRKEDIESKNNDVINAINSEIALMKEQIFNLENSSIRYYLNMDGYENEFLSEFEMFDKKLRDFLVISFKNGSLTKRYKEYVSYFYEGDVKSIDKAFLYNVKNKIRMEYDYTLSNLNYCYENLTGEDFEDIYTFNYEMFDYVTNKHLSIIGKLSENWQKNNIDFVDFLYNYVSYTKYKKRFIDAFVDNDVLLWELLSSFEENENKLKVMELKKRILSNASIDNLISLNKNGIITTEINNIINYIDLFESNLPIAKLQRIIENLNIKFSSIDFDKIDENIKNMIINSNGFEINYEIVNQLMRRSSEEWISYSNVKSSFDKYTYDYIFKDINMFFTEIAFNENNNYHGEVEEEFIEIINSEIVTDQVKDRIIQSQNKIDIKLTDISLEVKWESLLSFNVLGCELENIIIYIIKFGFDKAIESYINANDLIKLENPYEIDISAEEYDEIINDLVSSSIPLDNKFDLIVDEFKYVVSNIKYFEKGKSKIEYLLVNKLVEWNQLNVDEIIRYPNLFNLFIQYRSNNTKNEVLVDNKYIVKGIAEADLGLEKLYGFYVDYLNTNGKQDIYKDESISFDRVKALLNDLDQGVSLYLLASQVMYYDAGQIRELLQLIKYDYRYIMETSRRTIYEYTEPLKYLIEKIKRHFDIINNVIPKEGNKVKITTKSYLSKIPS